MSKPPTIIKLNESLDQVAEEACGLDLCRALQINDRRKPDPEKLPFIAGDATAGTENELQTAVSGTALNVDLPLSIRNSDFYTNLMRRVNSGDMPRSRLADLNSYLDDDDQMQAWENSWVRFPVAYLSSYALKIFTGDLKDNKHLIGSLQRSDSDKFTFTQDGETWLRVPISYLFKLALAQSVSSSDTPEVVKKNAQRLMAHYLSDNTSPETFSFELSRADSDLSLGQNTAAEMARRYAFTQMLIQYANRVFKLDRHGQKAEVYFAPTSPRRQNQLNDLVPDSFYRELFMNPCLSGWDQGEAKHKYMILCHQVLSRSRLNAMKKLKDAGIITSNLVIMPNTSNISLANNGTHLSLGSQKLTRLLAEKHPCFTQRHEKWAGDLVIKISEHFLSLFVGTYSAAPWRLAFADFHPEKVLGFLPHELDYTHLRMIWRRWKKKANISILGQPLTPFGPEQLDRVLSHIFRLKGDFVPDQRLLDYLVALMSTDSNPALDGRPGNDRRILKDLASQGVFDSSMSLYLLYKMRRFEDIGFSGFEGRYYSLFYDFKNDFANAADLQLLITALAYRYIIKGEIRHHDIPDTPSIESERRQIFFGAAIGLPTFFVRKGSPNLFMQKILKKTDKIRSSGRYHGYMRLQQSEFRKALIRVLEDDGGDLIEIMNLEETIADLKERVSNPEAGTSARLSRAIMHDLPGSTPMSLRAEEFNRLAESYYRKDLKAKHYQEALYEIEKKFTEYSHKSSESSESDQAFKEILPENTTPQDYFARHQPELVNDTITTEKLATLLQLSTLI